MHSEIKYIKCLGEHLTFPCCYINNKCAIVHKLKESSWDKGRKGKRKIRKEVG